MPERILDFLKTRGEQLDRDIATGLGLSLDLVQSGPKRLATRGQLPS